MLQTAKGLVSVAGAGLDGEPACARTLPRSKAYATRKANTTWRPSGSEESNEEGGLRRRDRKRRVNQSASTDKEAANPCAPFPSVKDKMHFRNVYPSAEREWGREFNQWPVSTTPGCESNAMHRRPLLNSKRRTESADGLRNALKQVPVEFPGPKPGNEARIEYAGPQRIGRDAVSPCHGVDRHESRRIRAEVWYDGCKAREPITNDWWYKLREYHNHSQQNAMLRETFFDELRSNEEDSRHHRDKRFLRKLKYVFSNFVFARGTPARWEPARVQEDRTAVRGKGKRNKQNNQRATHSDTNNSARRRGRRRGVGDSQERSCASWSDEERPEEFEVVQRGNGTEWTTVTSRVTIGGDDHALGWRAVR